jgi:hypothetical protein
MDVAVIVEVCELLHPRVYDNLDTILTELQEDMV